MCARACVPKGIKCKMKLQKNITGVCVCVCVCLCVCFYITMITINSFIFILNIQCPTFESWNSALSFPHIWYPCKMLRNCDKGKLRLHKHGRPDLQDSKWRLLGDSMKWGHWVFSLDLRDAYFWIPIQMASTKTSGWSSRAQLFCSKQRSLSVHKSCGDSKRPLLQRGAVSVSIP